MWGKEKFQAQLIFHIVSFRKLRLRKRYMNKIIEFLNVEVDCSGLKVRYICGYGPQENSALEKKQNFWTQLSLEVESAQDAEVGLIIQMDGNLWSGPELIKGDPNPMNNNGKHFKEFLARHNYLTVVNSLDLCEGIITRSRITTVRTEKSVIDFFLVCDRILPFVRRMLVDEKKQYALSSFHTKKGVQYKKDSDHNPLVLWLEIMGSAKKPDRMEYFNFKNSDCQEKFKELTNSTVKLTSCFENDFALEKQCSKWFKELNEIFHQSFDKIRSNGKIKKTEVSELMSVLHDLKQKKKVTWWC